VTWLFSLALVMTIGATAQADGYLNASALYQTMSLTNDLATASNTEFKLAYGASIEAGFSGKSLSGGLRLDYMGYKIKAGSVSAELMQIPIYLIVGYRLGAKSYLKPVLGFGRFQKNSVEYKDLPLPNSVVYENTSNIILAGIEAGIDFGKGSAITFEGGFRQLLETDGKILSATSGAPDTLTTNSSGAYGRVGFTF
jgi:hypothetical protein